MAPKPHFPKERHRVWVGDGNLGYRRSIEIAGSVAAPLLAGFSFTLLVLILPSLSGSQTTIRTSHGVQIVTDTQAFSAAPEAAAIFFLTAGLLLVASVQAAIAVRYHAHTPSDYEEWYPQYFRDGDAGESPPSDLLGWSWEGAEPAQVGDRWFGGWPRKRLHEQVQIANWWATWTRRLYHAGILAFLVGVTLLALPADSAANFGRWFLFGLAVAGTVGEAVWILSFTYGDSVKSALARMRSRSSDGPLAESPAGSD